MNEAIGKLASTNAPVYCLIVILISVVLGGLIGVEREFNGHAAGLRTHILISISATLVGFICYTNSNLAPYLMSAVVISLGFISAGSIVQTGKDVKGITTSSTVWLTGIIGISVGFDYILEAIIVTLIGLVALVILSYVELKTSKRDPTVTLYFDTKAEKVADEIIKIAGNYGLKIRNISSKMSKKKNQDVLMVVVTFQRVPNDVIKAYASELSTSLSPLSIDVKAPRNL